MSQVKPYWVAGKPRTSPAVHEVRSPFDGHMVEIGPTAQLLEHPQHPHTRALVAANDADALAAIMNEGMTDPAVAEALLYSRNANWAEWIDNRMVEPLLAPRDAQAANYAFDVTPARLVTGIITERGICAASHSGLRQLFPEQQPSD